jgi:capsular polysaccharide biosynthesis protein
VNFSKKPGSYHQEQNRKLYIHRTGTRKIINEKEIVEVVKSFGFEIFQPEKRPDSMLDFCNASAVIGGHGAGLADSVFCRKNTPVLELIPSDHVFQYYDTLADSSQLDYGYLLSKSATEKPTGVWGTSYADFHVDPEILKRAIKKHFKD